MHKHHSLKLLFSILTLALLLTPGYVFSASGRNPPALEFDPDAEWLNVSRPLSLADLKGKVVILDFWTYGCINCIHVLDDLHRLEKKYGNRLAVIGVHSPKFDNEKKLSTLRNIIIRYGIEHPVIQDNNHEMMRYYRLRAWPTQLVIDPAGEILGAARGEGNYELFDEIIQEMLEKHKQDIDTTALPLDLEKMRLAKSTLAAPGKIAASATYVAISDSLHHRIILTDHHGSIEKIYGGGESGFADGDATTARFDSPQGLAFSGSGLYVADTGNHSIRYIDFQTDMVSTIAGNGTNEVIRSGNHNALSIGLRSPWDLALKDSWLYVAMSGMHQIWRLHLQKGRIEVYAGSGREGIDDGSLKSATFSQPSGLSLQGDWLYVADSEDSAVRRINLKQRKVETLVGTGLFDFGDRDGEFSKAELQHVLGVAALDDSTIFIADTYNHKLKKLDLDEERVQTLAGTGEPGNIISKGLLAQLDEPGGLTLLDKRILIADTNNHRIVQYDLATMELSEWPLMQAAEETKSVMREAIGPGKQIN